MIFNAPFFLTASGSALASLNNGLIGYWALNDNASSSLDSNHGSISGSGYSWETGKNNNCFYTGPSGSVYMSVPYTSSLKPTGALSVAFWINITSAPSSHNDTRVVIDSLSSSISNPNARYEINLVNFYAPLYGTVDTYDFSLIVYSSGSVPYGSETLYYYLTGSGADRPTAAQLINSWRHLAFTYDSATSSSMAYYNGTRVTYPNTTSSVPATTITGTLPDNGEPLFIGGWAQTNIGVDAKIDEYAVWNRALSPTEIFNLYYSGVGRYYPF